jgi:NADH:ubiquinone oxidoreductase subunit C
MSADELESAAARLGAKATKSHNTWTLRVEPAKVKEACAAISSIPGLYHLSTITAVDLGDRIELLYHFWKGRSFVAVETEVSKNQPALGSVSDLLASATLYEAEIQDLFGVRFEGNPFSGRRLLLSDDYPTDAPPPLRTEADPEKIRKLMKLE